MYVFSASSCTSTTADPPPLPRQEHPNPEFLAFEANTPGYKWGATVLNVNYEDETVLCETAVLQIEKTLAFDEVRSPVEVGWTETEKGADCLARADRFHLSPLLLSLA